jgi:hypothetical protein
VAHINEYFAELGVQCELTTSYMPQQNGVIERQNQIMVGTVRSMLKAKELPRIFWGEAVTAAVYALNHTLTRGNGGRTPTSYGWATCWSCTTCARFKCVVHMKTTYYLKKLDNHSKPTIFVGYKPGSKAYRV